MSAGFIASVRFVSLILGAMAIHSGAAYAALGPSTVSSLISESDSILRGTVVRSELTSEYNGIATVELKQVYVGWVPKRIFTLAWSRGDEDMPLTDVGQEYVFFLRRIGAELVEPTQVARSFWKLVPADEDGRLVTPYVGFMTYLRSDIPGLLGEAGIRAADLPWGRNRIDVQVMYLHVLVPALKERWRSRG